MHLDHRSDAFGLQETFSHFSICSSTLPQFNLDLRYLLDLQPDHGDQG
eukprot:06272.XXX_303016_303159_1 [CDS] Oithona nana genome sequencing.